MSTPPRIRKRRKISYLPSIISISLVLFMMGLFGIILINGNELSETIKENFQITVFLRADSKQEDMDRVFKTISQKEYCKSAKFISSDQAAQQFSKEVGQDFVEFLGYNPLQPSVEMFLKSEFANGVEISRINNEINRNPEVQEVVYQKIIIDEVNKNIKLIAGVLIGLSLVFLLIAITLINNTIRLNLYAQRFIIKSMQMVGATHSFIIKPFAIKSFLYGLYGGIIACMLLTGLLYAMPHWIRGIEKLYNEQQFAILYVVVIIVGLIITMLSSMVSTNKYLKMRIDELY
jgi:cell division transport system permease protein